MVLILFCMYRQKKIIQELELLKLSGIIAPSKRRDGRAVECTGLENQQG